MRSLALAIALSIPSWAVAASAQERPPDPAAPDPDPKAAPDPSAASPAAVDPSAPKPEAAEASSGQAAVAPAEEEGAMLSTRVPAYIALSVGVAGVAVGSIFGGMALGKKSDLDDACTSVRKCPPSEQGTIDDGKSLGNVSTVGFIIGGAALVAGAALFFLTLPPPKVARARSVFVGVDRVGYRF
jgi:hypothetical protein